MDDRQTKITEGAGLEESRLNQEFIEWLNVWGFRILMVVLVVAAGWVGKTRWDQYQEKRLDAALVELEAEIATGSPDGLVALAKKHNGVKSVWRQAMLNAADIDLESGRKALVPGGDPENPDDFLDGEAANKQLESAAGLYAQIIDRAGPSDDSIDVLDARSGHIAALISLQKADDARTELNELIALLETSGYSDLKRQAEDRLAELDKLIGAPMPPTYAELAVLAEQRGPITMYGETPEDLAAIRSRIKSEELIEPKQSEAPAPEPAVPFIEAPSAPAGESAPDDGQ